MPCQYTARVFLQTCEDLYFMVIRIAAMAAVYHLKCQRSIDAAAIKGDTVSTQTKGKLRSLNNYKKPILIPSTK